MTIQKAFITDDAFTIDDHGYAALVTADYTDKDTGAFDIVYDILGYCEAVSLRLGNNDILAVRELLGIGSEIERPFTYNELLTPKGRNDLIVALRALTSIANIAISGATWEGAGPWELWRDIATQCVGIAHSALEEIGTLRSPTDDDS